MLLIDPKKDFSEIYPPTPKKVRMFLGGQLFPELLEELPGPVFIVNMAQELRNFDPRIIKDQLKVSGYLYLGIDDWQMILPDDVLIQSLKQVLEALKSGSNLFIHCAAGVSRSGYFMTALHMFLYGWHYEKALNHIKFFRPIVEPNSYLRKQLIRLEPVLQNFSKKG